MSIPIFQFIPFPLLLLLLCYCWNAKLCLTLLGPHWLPMGFSRQEILKWASISFSRGSSWCRNWTWSSCHMSCIEGGPFNLCPLPPGNPQFMFYICNCILVLYYKLICSLLFKIPYISNSIWYLSFSVLLLHSVWESFVLLDGWIIFYCICLYAHLLYLFLYWWAFRLLLCLVYGE